MSRKIDIPIGETGEIDGVPVKSGYPENMIDLCHGCYFDDPDSENECKTTQAVCRQPDRIFKLIKKTDN